MPCTLLPFLRVTFEIAVPQVFNSRLQGHELFLSSNESKFVSPLIINLKMSLCFYSRFWIRIQFHHLIMYCVELRVCRSYFSATFERPQQMIFTD